MVNLLIVEDHALVREGLVQTLRQMEPGVTVYEACDSGGATALLKQGLVFNLILLDLALPGIDGLSYLRTLRRRYPAMPVLILSGYDDAHTVKKAMNGGACGFVSKTYPSERLLTAVHEMLAGKDFATSVLPAVSVAQSPRPPMGKYAEPSEFGLTERQAEVLGLMSRGKSNREIAEQLDLSEGTVKVHLTAIFKALCVSSRTQAMVVIARRGVRL